LARQHLNRFARKWIRSDSKQSSICLGITEFKKYDQDGYGVPLKQFYLPGTGDEQPGPRATTK